MQRRLELLPVPTGDRVLELIPRLQQAMSGTGPVLLPVPELDATETARLTTSLAAGAVMGEAEDDPHDPTALVVATSGSTGAPKGALLPASALLASAEATRSRLTPRYQGQPPAGTATSGTATSTTVPERWLLALPATHIAGLQVLLRAVAARTEPTVLDTAAAFTAERFVAAVDRMPRGRRLTSLVPTQLLRVLSDPEAATVLSTFDAVLVGGAATPQSLLDDAVQAGVRVVTTYGMSETCGGCVYDGLPLDGVSVSVDAFVGDDDRRDGRPGRVSITGPVVGRGYRDMPRHPAFQHTAGEPFRTFRTQDLAVLERGRWRVVGRVDDVITTGGVKIDPAVVESVLIRVTGVREVMVTGVPDPQWGEAVVAVVVSSDGGAPDLETLRRAARYSSGQAAAPRHLLLVDELPGRGIGKPDRSAVRRLATKAFGLLDT